MQASARRLALLGGSRVLPFRAEFELAISHSGKTKFLDIPYFFYTMRYVLYARKSTEDEDRQVLSIEAQLAELQEYSAKEKLDIVSGAASPRPAFFALAVRRPSPRTEGRRRIRFALIRAYRAKIKRYSLPRLGRA